MRLTYDLRIDQEATGAATNVLPAFFRGPLHHNDVMDYLRAFFRQGNGKRNCTISI